MSDRTFCLVAAIFNAIAGVSLAYWINESGKPIAARTVAAFFTLAVIFWAWQAVILRRKR